MVQRPKRIEARQRRLRTLLPVDPPEVDAVVLVGLMHNFEIVVDEGIIGDIKRDHVLGLGVNAHRLCHILIAILKKAYALGGVQIQGDLEVSLLNLLQERLVYMGPW